MNMGGGFCMKVLITGGYGFIGSHVAQLFYEKGYEIHILDNLSSGKTSNVTIPHHAYICSIVDPSCRNIFEQHDFRYVIHLAAQVSVAKSVNDPIDDEQNNISGLLNMLLLSKQYDVKKFIFASSAAVYGDNVNLPLQETELPTPISPYGISKLAGELYCKTLFPNSTCLRFANVYGPRQTKEGEGGVVSIFTSRAARNNLLYVHGDGEQTRDFIYVGDIATAIYSVATSEVIGVYNVGTNTRTSVNSIIETLRNLHGKVDTEHIAPRIGDIYHSSLDNTSLIEASEWRPTTSLYDGLKVTYHWETDVLFHEKHSIK